MGVNEDTLRRHYKKNWSGFHQWQQLMHAEKYLLYPQNITAHMAIDDVSLSQGELYTILSSRDRPGRKGKIAAVIRGTKAEDLISVLSKLPESLRVRLDVKDFATPVQFVSAVSQGDKASISIEPTGLYDYMAYQTDNKLTVSIKPLTQQDADKRKAEKFAYTGEKLSLNFQDIDVRSVLQLIADFTDLNLVASDTVTGNITLRLQNVPWDQALDLVLKTKGLDKRKIGNVLLVAPADEIAARERQELESQKQIAELAPLRRELIQVNYAKASDMAQLFQSVTSADGSADDRGSITVDDRTNSIIAYQTQERLDELRRIVSQLDVAVRQVMIEARIVEANVDYDKALGVNWRGARVGNSNFVVGGSDGNRVGAPGYGQKIPNGQLQGKMAQTFYRRTTRP